MKECTTVLDLRNYKGFYSFKLQILIAMEKRCLECEEELFGRIDKKFCSDQCRNAYNNKSLREENNYIRSVNSILRKNRRILAKLNPKGKAKVHRDQLLKKGFSFNYHTDLYKTKENKVYHFCYDQGYLELEGQLFALVKKKEYINQPN